jgi:hypothetical protein
MLNDIFMWIFDAIGTVLWFCFRYVGLPLIGIAILGWLWPYIAGVVKFLVFMIPVAIVVVLCLSGELLSCLLPLLGIAAGAAVLLLLFRFFDQKFGILMSRDEAEREGLL